jgi:hypothetical protein
MTLIIKELTIKGIVTDEHTIKKVDHDALELSLAEMKSSLKKEIMEAVLSKLESNTRR